MHLDPEFKFTPLPAIPDGPLPLDAAGNPPDPLGPLRPLVGKWRGPGFNMIWRPNNITAPGNPPGQDRFLEINVTDDQIEFTEIAGDIPNRGLLQPDIKMHGVTYLQQISDANVGGGLHIEPGIWAVVPPTTNPLEDQTVVRMASIPHGTTILAQGIASTVAVQPIIPVINIKPFPIGDPGHPITFPEETLTTVTAFRSPAPQLIGVTQAMLDNPNSVLTSALAGQTVAAGMTVLKVSSDPASPVLGGGVDNTAFLTGSSGGPNAQTAVVTATFWIEEIEARDGHPAFTQLQYTQTVLLNFNTLSWPHITIGTLRKL